MGIKRYDILNLTTRNSPYDGGNTQDIQLTTGNAGNSTTSDGGYSGDISFTTGAGGSTTDSGSRGRDSGDIIIQVGTAGDGYISGGDGGSILVDGGDGGDANVGSGGDGGDGGNIIIYSGAPGSGDGAGSTGVGGGIQIIPQYGALGLAISNSPTYILSGASDTPFYHRGPLSVNDSGSPAAIGVSVSLDFRGTNKAPLFPRMTTTQRDAMTTPVNGMIIYNTTNLTHEGYQNGSWVPFPGTGSGGGEANTVSNAGSGTSLYYTKTGVDLEFNGIKSETSRLTVFLDTGTHDIELTVNEADLLHNDVAGEFAAVTLKASPVSADIILIEDSADSNNKKRITVGSLASGSSETQIFTVPSDVAVRDLVYVTGALTADKADHTAVATSKSIGVVIDKPTSVTAEVKFYGIVSGYSGLTAGSEQFLGLDGAMIESSLPSTPGYVIKKVGMAISTTALLIDIRQGITL